MAKKNKVQRQEWRPHWLLRLASFLLTSVLGLAKLALGGIATVVLVLVVCALVMISDAGEFLQEDVVPNVSFDLDSYKLDQTSFIYFVDNNGKIRQMQKIYTDTDRQWATLAEIPEDLIHAAIAIEDKRFYEHQGVDWITTVKACARMFFNDASAGGSTITQQLIKNLTKEDSITVQRKVQEIFKAQKFESEYDKDVVMEWYLNTIYLGKGCYGVKSAARRYFGKELGELNTAECASLISITNNPSLFDPYIRPQNNRNRQLTTLDQMLDQNWITQQEYDEAVAYEMVFTSTDEEKEPVYTCKGFECDFADTAENYTMGDDGLYYCPRCSTLLEIEEHVGDDMYSWFTEMVMDDVAQALAERMGMDWDEQTTQDLCMNMIKKGGYHIYSTIDMDIQNIVDEVYTNLDNVPTTSSDQQLLSAIVVIDNRTGDVVAVAGSVGPKTSFDAFSYANDGGLQTGSVMKPLTVYAPAFELGIVSPASVIPDAPLYGNFPWNESRSYSGQATVLSGIQRSLNTTAVHVLDRVGFAYSFEFGKEKFGLSLLDEEVTSSGEVLSDSGYSPLALGGLTYGVTVREMASAYATFPNAGVYREDRTFTKVYDSEGNLVIDNTQESEKILSDRANNYINYCLRSVVTGGTGTAADLGTTSTAGKTGTTSDNRDRWFIGYTAYYTAAVWCGYENPEEIRLTGNWTNPALRMWKQVMSKIHENVEWRDIYSSENMYYTSVCMDSGKAASAYCSSDPRGSRVSSALVYSGDGASGSCDMHVSVEWCNGGDGVPNQYCRQVTGNSIGSRVMIKGTWAEINRLRSYGGGITDDMIYLEGGDFHGINGNVNVGISAPYKMCTVHTAESIKPPETEPTVPETEATAPVAP